MMICLSDTSEKESVNNTAACDNNRAVAYVRVSTDEQAQEGVSLALQERHVRVYCDLKGLELVDIIRDEGISASKPLSDRRGGAEFLRTLASGEIANVISLKLDRFFRSASDALNETKRWDKAGVALHLVDQGGATIDTKNSTGKLFFTLLAAMAEFERNLISERTTAAMRHLKTVRRAYSPTPFGFDRIDDELRENADELRVVKRIREMRAGELSLGKIAATLNREGVPTKTGKKWHGSTVHYILRNQLYQEVGVASD